MRKSSRNMFLRTQGVPVTVLSSLQDHSEFSCRNGFCKGPVIWILRLHYSDYSRWQRGRQMKEEARGKNENKTLQPCSNRVGTAVAHRWGQTCRLVLKPVDRRPVTVTFVFGFDRVCLVSPCPASAALGLQVCTTMSAEDASVYISHDGGKYQLVKLKTMIIIS